MCATVCPKLNPSPFRQGIPKNCQCVVFKSWGIMKLIGHFKWGKRS